jgi:hypothetical protein
MMSRYGEEAVHFGPCLGRAEPNTRRVASTTRHNDGLANPNAIV